MSRDSCIQALTFPKSQTSLFRVNTVILKQLRHDIVSVLAGVNQGEPVDIIKRGR
jgi:hypothetical protein